MPDTTTRAQEIRAELDKLAPRPEPGTPGSAAALARHLSMEAEIVWVRLTAREAGGGPDDAALLGAYFAAACALDSLALRDPSWADEYATEIVRRWDDGLSVGEWTWEHLREDAAPVARLAQELAEATVKPAGVVVDPADVEAVLTAKGPLPDALYDRLRAVAGMFR